MPAARPSQAQIANVIAALRAAGLDVGEVRVDADGGFVVRPAGVDSPPTPAPSSPPIWGQ